MENKNEKDPERSTDDINRKLTENYDETSDGSEGDKSDKSNDSEKMYE